MEDNRVNRNVLLVDGSPLVETDFVLGMKHANFTPDTSGHEYVGLFLTQVQGGPCQGIKVFPRIEINIFFNLFF